MVYYIEIIPDKAYGSAVQVLPSASIFKLKGLLQLSQWHQEVSKE